DAGLAIGGWQRHAKAAAAAAFAAHADLALHQRHQPAHDHQTDARALDAAALHAQPVEGLEEVGLLLGRHADAGVFHLNDDLLFLLPAAQLHLAALAVVLDRVAQQVDQDL